MCEPLFVCFVEKKKSFPVWILVKQTVSHRSVHHMSACVSACFPGDMKQKDRNKERKRDKSADHTCHHGSVASPLTDSIYQRVNLLTDVAAWKTSASSARRRMLTQTAWHGEETHAHTVWCSVMSAWSHTLTDSLQTTERLLARPQGRGGGGPWAAPGGHDYPNTW